MKINDIRIELDTLHKHMEAPCEVELILDEPEKIFILHFLIYTNEIDGNDTGYKFYPSSGTGQNIRNNTQPRHEICTLEDCMPIIKRKVATVLVNRMFSEWDKMQSLKK